MTNFCIEYSVTITYSDEAMREYNISKKEQRKFRTAIEACDYAQAISLMEQVEETEVRLPYTHNYSLLIGYKNGEISKSSSEFEKMQCRK